MWRSHKASMCACERERGREREGEREGGGERESMCRPSCYKKWTDCTCEKLASPKLEKEGSRQYERREDTANCNASNPKE